MGQRWKLIQGSKWLANSDPPPLLQRGDALKECTADAVRADLEGAGVDLSAKNGGGPNLRMEKAAF